MELKDILILVLVLIGAVVIFAYSGSRDGGALRITNRDANKSYKLQLKPEILFGEKTQLKARIIDPLKQK